MTDPSYASLEEALQDPVFPDVDMALRRGRHIDLDDPDWFTFLVEAQPLLERFYRRFGCELCKVADGYFYLLPSGDRLGRRQLSRGEMLVGQALALLHLDPATVKAAGVVPAAQLLELLVSLVGKDRLIVTLNFRKSVPRDERVAEETARKEVAKALRGLDRLGFVERLPEDLLRLRTPLMRFVDPVRGLTDPASALARLMERGEAAYESPAGEGGDAHDDPDGIDTDPEDAG